MSTAVYPQGLRLVGAPGQGYISWKGTGVYSTPVGIAPKNIRPLTNNDIGNNFSTGFGLPRPMKHYRRGTQVPTNAGNITMDRVLNRSVRSSTLTTTDIMDVPGSFITKENSVDEINFDEALDVDCTTCRGAGLVVSYYPTVAPVKNSGVPNCCSAASKALKRCRSSAGMIGKSLGRKTGYISYQQYAQSRCQTIEQKSFHYQTLELGDDAIAFMSANPMVTEAMIRSALPGSPLSRYNTYVGNCNIQAAMSRSTVSTLVDVIAQILVNQGIITSAQATDFRAYQAVWNGTPTEGMYAWIDGQGEGVDVTTAKTAVATFLQNPHTEFGKGGITNMLSCKRVMYKPSNYKYAKQGGVSSGTQTFKLGTDTVIADNYKNRNTNIFVFGDPYKCESRVCKMPAGQTN